MSPDERDNELAPELDDPGNEDPGSQLERQAPQREGNISRPIHEHETPPSER